MARRERSIEPKQYLAYLVEMWNPMKAAQELGCNVSDIRALQKNRKFVERFLAETVQLTGPEQFQGLKDAETAIEMIQRQKQESFWALREMGADVEVPANVRARIHGKFFDAALTLEGVSQKVQHDHTVTHKLDPESAVALASAGAESSRLLADRTIDVTPEE